MEGLQKFKVLFCCFVRDEIFLKPKKYNLQLDKQQSAGKALVQTAPYCFTKVKLKASGLNIVQQVVDKDDEHDSQNPRCGQFWGVQLK